MANKIKIKRGLHANIGNLTLEAGELGVALDTQVLYVGDQNGDAQPAKALSTGIVDSANKLTTPRAIALSGDISGTANFDGSANISISSTLPNIATAGTKAKITFNAKGQVTSGADLIASDIPSLATSKITGLDTALGLKADLVAGKVPSSQLPSFVDDVEEYANFAALPVTGETGKIYITLDDNKTFRWSGSVYASLGSGVALGETSETAYRGDRGKTAYDYSQIGHLTSNSTIDGGTF